MKDLEHKLQTACVNWFKLQYPKYIWNIFAIPNGGQRNIRIAAKLKREGVLSGVADLHIAIPSGNSSGLFIELKIKPNRATDNQILFGKRMIECGYHWELCYSFDRFKEIITEWMKEAKC